MAAWCLASPGSAAAARGDAAPAGAKYDTYVQRGPGYSDPAAQVALLNKKIELLTRKVSLLGRNQPATPETKAIDDELARLDSQLAPK